VSNRRSFGTVRKLPSGRWQARWRDASNDLLAAPQTFATKSDASRWLAETEADIARGQWIDPRRSSMTFSDFADEWWRATTHLRLSTRTSYEYLLRSYLRPGFGSVPLSRITPLNVQAWRADLMTSGLAPNTVAKAYRLLARILRAAVNADYLAKSPCILRGASADEIPEMRFATAQQVEALANVVPDRDRALIYVAAYSSLRFGELAGLRRRDVNPLLRTVAVVQQITEVRGQVIVGPPKTASSRRTVQLPDFVAAILEEHLVRFSDESVDGLVFPSADGGPLRRSNFRSRVWLPATKACGVPGLRFHDLRHTGSTLAAASGAPLKALMQRMGHTTVGAALRYQHVIDGQQQAIADYLDNLARVAATPVESPLLRDVSGTFVARNGHAKGDAVVENAVTSTNSGGASKNRTYDLVLIRDAL
jgi:integrase